MKTKSVDSRKKDSFFANLFKIEEIGVVSALLVITALLFITSENFSDINNLIGVIRQASYIGMLAVGMVFVISTGDIDISVAAIYNLTAIFMGILYSNGFPFWAVIVLGILGGALCGFINGSIGVFLKIPMIIVTLGTQTIFKGLSLVISNATTVAKFPKENWFFNNFGEKAFGLSFGKVVIPGSIVLMIFVAFIGHILYNKTKFGRYVCGLGSNRTAAQFSGLNVNKYRILVMVLMGVICSIVALGALSFFKAADPSMGAGTEMMAIASAVIGGASLSGGAGSIIGAIFGALIIAVIRNGMILLGVSVYWQGVVTGVVIISAVTLDYIIKKKSLFK